MLLSEKYQFRGTCVVKKDLKSNEIIMRFPNASIAAIETGNKNNSPHRLQVALRNKRGALCGTRGLKQLLKTLQTKK